MPLIELRNVEEKEILPGLTVKFVHAVNITLAYWHFESGVELPRHSHIHEQVVNVIEGELILVLDNEPLHLTPGKVVVIPPDVPHSGKAVTECRVIDVFYPTRDDYK
ncbi:MAG: cupin domain-containing protein [Candidatus Zixiibacteriota bacterium]